MPIKLVKPSQMGVSLTPTPGEIVRKMITEYEITLHALSTLDLKKRFPGRVFSNGVPFEEAKSAWVSRKEIEQLLDDNEGDGLRILYGCHRDTEDTGEKHDYIALHNVILVATKSDAEHQEEHSVDQLKESEDPAKANSVITSGIFTNSGGDLMPLCPPSCP